MWQVVAVGVVVAVALVYCICYAMPPKTRVLLSRWHVWSGARKKCDQCSTCGACVTGRRPDYANSTSADVQPVRFYARPKPEI